LVCSIIGACRCVVVRQQSRQDKSTNGQATKYPICKPQSNPVDQSISDFSSGSFAATALNKKEVVFAGKKQLN
jgi:hypothetical protein